MMLLVLISTGHTVPSFFLKLASYGRSSRASMFFMTRGTDSLSINSVKFLSIISAGSYPRIRAPFLLISVIMIPSQSANPSEEASIILRSSSSFCRSVSSIILRRIIVVSCPAIASTLCISDSSKGSCRAISSSPMGSWSDFNGTLITELTPTALIIGESNFNTVVLSVHSLAMFNITRGSLVRNGLPFSSIRV